ncbi:helix-hairpin-helix domain-containing protein [Neobacillus sp. LXY-1]|uniref:helix-hairpin-helix domain-containing protein n=1 Tax=Neobacillus sp. LXY-1 TaxID=3379133 RepID=UPI003EE1C027
MKNWLIEHKLYAVMALFFVLGGGSYLYYQHESQTQSISTQDLILEEKNQPQLDDKQSEKQSVEVKVMMVDIKGQIKEPGVYRANVGERVIDIITRAGGMTETADESQVNFAEHVEDEMVIYIPQKGKEGDFAPGSTSGTNAVGTSGQNQAKINLNKATETELQNLPGIGPAKAAAIIEYRESNGPYKAVEDLKNISGIGDKTFEKLKDLIVVR